MEELQRSVIFFTRANAQLKQKNEALETMLFAARSQIENGGGGGAVPTPAMATVMSVQESAFDNVDDSQDKKPAAVVQGQASTPPMDQSSPAMNAAPAPIQQQSAPAAAMMAQQQQQPSQQQMANMANWIAMAQATSMVPNPMAAAMGPSAMGMFGNPMAMAAGLNNPAAAAGFMGMMSAQNPFIGQFQQQQHQAPTPAAATALPQAQTAANVPQGSMMAPAANGMATAVQVPMENTTDVSTTNDHAGDVTI